MENVQKEGNEKEILHPNFYTPNQIPYKEQLTLDSSGTTIVSKEIRLEFHKETNHTNNNGLRFLDCDYCQ